MAFSRFENIFSEICLLSQDPGSPIFKTVHFWPCLVYSEVWVRFDSLPDISEQQNIRSDVLCDLWSFHLYNSGKKNNSVKTKFRYQRDLKGDLKEKEFTRKGRRISQRERL